MLLLPEGGSGGELLLQGEEARTGRPEAGHERASLGDDVFEALHTMLQDINRTHVSIQEVSADQLQLLQKLAEDVERGHRRMEGLTKKIEAQLR